MTNEERAKTLAELRERYFKLASAIGNLMDAEGQPLYEVRDAEKMAAWVALSPRTCVSTLAWPIQVHSHQNEVAQTFERELVEYVSRHYRSTGVTG